MTMKASNRSVSFGTVGVREYERIAGDHPDAKGPCLGISWRFVQQDEVSVDHHMEKHEEPREKLMPLNAETRHFMLYHVFDITKDEIRRAEKVAARVQRQRQESYRKWEESFKSKVSKTMEAETDAEPVRRRPAPPVERRSVPPASGTKQLAKASPFRALEADGKKVKAFFTDVRQNFRARRGNYTSLTRSR